MLQQDEPDDYVVATGETHSVREFVEVAFARPGSTTGALRAPGPRFFRPAEVDLLVGDATKAHKKLGWDPRWISTASSSAWSPTTSRSRRRKAVRRSAPLRLRARR